MNMGYLDTLVREYMRSEWMNKRRVTNEFQAREELLGCGMVYTYRHGTTEPLCTYMDKERTFTNTNPLILDAAGMPHKTIIMPPEGADIFVKNGMGQYIGSVSAAPPDFEL
jgi:hypothetical protein